MTYEEEAKLWDAYDLAENKGGPERDSLVEYYTGWVTKMAAGFRSVLPRSVETNDLIQAGHIGVIKAIPRFNRSVGTPFMLFARIGVMGQMKSFLRNCDPLTRRRREAVREGRRADCREVMLSALPSSSMCFGEGREVGDDTHIQIDAKVRGVNLDLLCDEDKSLAAVDRADYCDYLLDSLTPRQREIMEMWIFDGKPQEQIARELGITQGAVNHVRNRAKNRMRKAADAQAT